MRAKRANINIDLDAYTFASGYANAKGLPLGAAISELIRRAESAPEPLSPKLTRNKRGLLVMAKGGRLVTPELVRRYSEDEPE
jgi:hypothetical protein